MWYPFLQINLKTQNYKQREVTGIQSPISLRQQLTFFPVFLRLTFKLSASLDRRLLFWLLQGKEEEGEEHREGTEANGVLSVVQQFNQLLGVPVLLVSGPLWFLFFWVAFLVLVAHCEKRMFFLLQNISSILIVRAVTRQGFSTLHASEFPGRLIAA